MQEVEGVLQLVARPVLLHLLVGLKWQELVGGAAEVQEAAE
jgi:hypothetical protein